MVKVPEGVVPPAVIVPLTVTGAFAAGLVGVTVWAMVDVVPPPLLTVRLVAKLATGAAAPVISVEEVRRTQVEGGSRAGHGGCCICTEQGAGQQDKDQRQASNLRFVVKPHGRNSLWRGRPQKAPVTGHKAGHDNQIQLPPEVLHAVCHPWHGPLVAVKQ